MPGLADVRRDKAEVLRNDPGLGKSRFNGIEQSLARCGQPYASSSMVIAGGYGIVACKASEMVDTQNIIKLKASFDTADPPRKAILLHELPVV